MNKNVRLINVSFIVLLFIAVTVLLSSCSTVPLNQLSVAKSHQGYKFLVMHYSGQDIQTVQSSINNAEQARRIDYIVPASVKLKNNNDYYQGDKTFLKQAKKTVLPISTLSSYWQGRNNIDEQAVDIEIVNHPECKQAKMSLIAAQFFGEKVAGENVNVAAEQNKNVDEICFYPDYQPQQIQRLIKLSKSILAKNPNISPTQIIGYADITPRHNSDPGPRFPWYQLYQNGIGAWYNKAQATKYWQLFLDKQLPNVGLVQAALASYGYGIIETGEFDQSTIDTLSAFQMHFVPWQVTGVADEKTVAVLFALLDKYFPTKLAHLITRYQQELMPKVIPVVINRKGQVDSQFPQTERSDRELVNDRAIFKSYRRRGDIIIDNNDATSADIYVNGQQLNIAAPLEPYHSYAYSLKKRTKSGDNTLRVENILPQGASLNVTIPYPKLIDVSNRAKNKQRFKKVDQLINQDVKEGFPGAVLVVIKDGKILKNDAYGYERKYADGGEPLAEPVKMTTGTLFDIASNTKMFATNFAAMKLVSEGKLDVNKRIVDYLPQYRGAGREMRLVKDFLTHNAGYSPQIKFFTRDNQLGEQFFSQNSAKTKNLILTKVPFAVGLHSKRMYSDTDYMLLGMLIEKITKMPLDSYVEHEIYHALQLNKLVFNPLQKGFAKNQIAATEIIGNTRGGRVDFENIRRYVLQGEVHDEKAFYSFAGVAGHAGLFASAKELGVLAQVLLNRGGYGKLQLFKPSVIDQFIKPDDGDGSYGLGWRRADNGARKWQFGPYASPSAFGHTGWTGTVTVIDPEHDLAIILLTNARHSKVEGDDKNYYFKGKEFETGKYGSVISLVYEAVLDH
jgi:serine-type D-Ala-D-Ala carboxypeptidase